MNKNKVRFYEIDFLRFLAALAVVMFHYTFRGFAEGGYSTVEFPIIGDFSRYGYLGVNLFFIISGFVILLSAMNRTAIKFAISRFIRLYPAFWAGVTLTALVMFFYNSDNPVFSISLSQYLMNMTMISGYLGVEHVDGVYWTLLVELKFYALIFLLLLSNRIKQIELFLGIWLAIVVFNLIVPLPKIIAFFFFPEWAPLFISGSLFYLINAKGLNTYKLIMLGCAYLLAIHYTIMEVNHMSEFYNSDLSPLVSIFWVSLFYAFFTLTSFNKTSWIRSPKLVKIGLLTYPLYLVHQNIGFIAFNVFGGTINKYVLLIVIVTAMLVLAWLIQTLVEKRLGAVLYNKSQFLQQKFT